MVGGLVGQHDLGLRPTGPGLGRQLGPRIRTIRGRHSDAGHRMPTPIAAGRTGMNLNADPVVALSKLRRDSRLAIQSERLLDLELVDLHGLNRQAKSFAAGSQRHLGKTRRGHHGLPMHLVIGQPRHHLGSDICLPHMVAARRHLDVQPQATGEHPASRCASDCFAIQYLECSHGDGGISASRPPPASAGVTPSCGELRMEEQGFVVPSLHRRGDDEAVGRRRRLQACR